MPVENVPDLRPVIQDNEYRRRFPASTREATPIAGCRESPYYIRIVTASLTPEWRRL